MTPDDIARQTLKVLAQGKITPDEADAYLQHKCSITLAQAQAIQEPLPKLGRKMSNKTIAVFLMLALIVSAGGIFISDPVSFGMLVFESDSASNSITTNTLIDSIRVSGTLIGEGSATIQFQTMNGSLLVATVTSDDGTPRTDKASYTPGEQATIQHIVESSTLYLDDGTESVTVDNPFNVPAAEGSYTVIVVQNDSGELSTTRIPVIVSMTPIDRTTIFTDVCEETCAMEPASGIVIVTNTTPINLTRVEVTTPTANNAPTITTPIEAIITTNTTNIDLTTHFTDADGDELLYSTGGSSIATLTINESTLTIEPISSGTETITVYASDLHELVPTEFTLTVEMPIIIPITESNTTNTTEETPPDTTDPTNNTDPSLNDTTSTPIVTPLPDTTPGIPTIFDCDNPDPNARPIECLQQDTQYSQSQDIYWEDSDRTAVAKFNELGNLLITGDVIQQSPTGQGTFAIGNFDRDANLIPAIWVDAQGNLRLRGTLHEEQSNIVPPPGSYSIVTRNGIYLMYADKTTGDMWLRGNVIPYRKEIR